MHDLRRRQPLRTSRDPAGARTDLRFRDTQVDAAVDAGSSTCIDAYCLRVAVPHCSCHQTGGCHRAPAQHDPAPCHLGIACNASICQARGHGHDLHLSQRSSWHLACWALVAAVAAAAWGGCSRSGSEPVPELRLLLSAASCRVGTWSPMEPYCEHSTQKQLYTLCTLYAF